MSIEQLVGIALVVVSSVMLVRFAPTAIRAWRIYTGTGDRRQQDARERAPAPPTSVRDREAVLGESGYRPLGETSLQLPTGERFAWIMAAEAGDSYVILTATPGSVALSGIYSAWPDGMWLGTLHPIGTPTDRTSLQVRTVTTTLTEAVAVHQEGLERLRRVHGAPRPVRSMPEMLALDADYRIRFGGSRLRPLTFRLMLPCVLAAVVLALSLVLLIASLR